MNFLIHTALTVTEEDARPLIAELWDYFVDKYLNGNVYYEHMNIDTSDMHLIFLIVLGLCVGISIAAFAAAFNKRVLGGVVRKILAAEATSPESAKTLEELGLENKFIARYAVTKSTSVRRVVKCCEEQEFVSEQNAARTEYEARRESDRKMPKFVEHEYEINPYADRFYIPEDIKYMADVKFEKRGTTWVGAIACTFVCIILFFVLVISIPNILHLVDDFVGAIATE